MAKSSCSAKRPANTISIAVMVVVGAVFVPAIAFAQSSGCETVGAEVFCPPPEAADPFFGGAHMAGFRMRVERAREALKLKQQAQRDAVKSEHDLRKKVGSLIASGECTEAYKIALNEGNLTLASEARKLCAPLPQ